MRTKLQVRPLICSAQAVRGPDQTGWWSHVFVLGRIEKPSYHILLNPLFILSVYVMMWRTANV